MSEDRLAYVKNRLDRIQVILNELNDLADKDHALTTDEQEIILNVKNNIAKYKEMANQLANEIDISDEDLERLYIFEKKIVQDASSEALTDGHISGDESDLLQKILDFFTEINEED